jgi:nucleotide-binding universal stress UspA family protein
LIAYDGTQLSSFRPPGRPCDGVGAGLAAVVVGPSDSFGMGTLPPDPATLAAVAGARREHASTVAREGAELARSVGLVAEARAVPDEVDVADALIEMARELGAAVVVVGSHGISGLGARACSEASREG